MRTAYVSELRANITIASAYVSEWVCVPLVARQNKNKTANFRAIAIFNDFTSRSLWLSDKTYIQAVKSHLAERAQQPSFILICNVDDVQEWHSSPSYTHRCNNDRAFDSAFRVVLWHIFNVENVVVGSAKKIKRKENKSKNWLSDCWNVTFCFVPKQKKNAHKNTKHWTKVTHTNI